MSDRPMAQKKGHGSLHPWPFALAQSYAWVQAPKEEKAKEEREYPHHANIKKQSKFFVKGKIGFSPGVLSAASAAYTAYTLT